MLIKLDQSTVVGEDYHLPPEKLLSGNPKQTIWVHYTSAAGNFIAGIWRSEPGKWHISYTEEEFCHMLEGLSIVTETGGSPVTVRAGESFVIPSGFVGTWEVVEATTKRFVIYEPSANLADGQPAPALS